MKLHEFQAKGFLREYGIPVPEGRPASTPQEARAIAASIGFPVMVKAQVLVGGRGKAGGVKMAKSADEAEARARDILGMKIKGIEVQRVLMAAAVDIAAEFYVSLAVDRSGKTVQCIASASGGMDIEEIAATQPDRIIRFPLDPENGPVAASHQGKLASAFGRELSDQAWAILQGMYRLFSEKDCSLVEINPCAKTQQGKLIAADAKVIFDDNALFRHPELENLRSPEEYGADEMDARVKRPFLCRPGRDHWLHRQRGRTFHGNHGPHQVFRRQSGQLPGRRGQLESREGAERASDHPQASRPHGDPHQHLRRHHPL